MVPRSDGNKKNRPAGNGAASNKYTDTAESYRAVPRIGAPAAREFTWCTRAFPAAVVRRE